jgi:hypothetical protein
MHLELHVYNNQNNALIYLHCVGFSTSITKVAFPKTQATDCLRLPVDIA